MRPLKLYIKTTLLASAVTILVLAATILLVGVRVARLVQEKEKELTRTQAVGLAEHITNMSDSYNLMMLKATAGLVQRAHPGLVAVRIWEFGPLGWQEVVATGESMTPAMTPESVAAMSLRRPTEWMTARLDGAAGARFHVFVPLRDGLRAVEVVERLDSPVTVITSYVRDEAGLALAAVLLITGGTYALFRYFVYRPLDHLLAAMQRTRSGELTARAQITSPDEMGQLAEQFNLMLSRVEAMTAERAAHEARLQERVREATGELQQRNEQLASANLELWRTSRRLSEVERLAAAGQTAAQFAHEVGTPLNLISGHVQLLELNCSEGGSEKQRLGVITEQIARIERIVRRMLDRTRFDAGTQTALDVAQVLRRTLDAAGPLLAERQVTLHTTLGEALPPIKGDLDHLQQVFLNLINNALDAMPAGGTLAVSAARDDQGYAPQLALEFSDTGSGMSEEVRARIFDPLYTTKERGRGTGLGLVIVRQLVQEHGGQIEVDSTPGVGTRFRLRFPVAV